MLIFCLLFGMSASAQVNYDFTRPSEPNTMYWPNTKPSPKKYESSVSGDHASASYSGQYSYSHEQLLIYQIRKNALGILFSNHVQSRFPFSRLAKWRASHPTLGIISDGEYILLAKSSRDLSDKTTQEIYVRVKFLRDNEPQITEWHNP